MPVFQDKKRNTWYCKFYYTDFTGEKKQKLRRGFPLKRDAQAWEKQFLASLHKNPSLPFSDLQKSYLEDKRVNLKQISYETKKSRILLWIAPYFAKPINEIEPADIRQWENMLCSAVGKNGKPLSLNYRQNLVTELSSMFNYAVKIYGLGRNPVQIAGNTAGKKVKRCDFWTLGQFQQFLGTFSQHDEWYTLFNVLYWTGCRLGELQALTVADVLTDPAAIQVNKTYHMINGEHVITRPKTAKSTRDIYIPEQLSALLADHIGRMYQARKTDRLFPYGDTTIASHFKKHTRDAGLPEIRLHDIRHSHASLLINSGASVLLVSERLGHENVTTTLNIYSHLFPSKQSEIAEKLTEVWADS